MPLTAESVVFGIEHLDCLADADLIAFDSETTGLQPTLGGLRLLQLGAPKRPVVVIDCWELDHDDWLKLRSFFAVERTYLAHNAVFDIGWLQEHAIHLAGKVRCTMLASKLLTNGIPNLKHGLGVVVERYLQRELSKELQASDWSAPQLSREQLAYAAADVQALLDLHGVGRAPSSCAIAECVGPGVPLPTGDGADAARRFAVQQAAAGGTARKPGGGHRHLRGAVRGGAGCSTAGGAQIAPRRGR